jgi:hypothetical protein
MGGRSDQAPHSPRDVEAHIRACRVVQPEKASGSLILPAAWERVWIWRRLELLAYAVDFRRSLRKADPALPILLVICGTGPARSPFSPTEPPEGVAPPDAERLRRFWRRFHLVRTALAVAAFAALIPGGHIWRH